MQLHERLVGHVRFCALNRQSSFVGALVAPETVDLIHNGIIDLVAELDNWPSPVNYNYSTFQTANQTLYFRYGIMIEVFWRPVAPPDPSNKYVEFDVEKYSKVFFEWKPTTHAEVQDGY